MKNTFIIIGIVILLLVGGMWWSKSLQKSNPDMIARNGLHWHPELAIYVKGEKQEIPANIGLVGGHQPTHTHSEDASKGVVHLEFQGLVRKQDTVLGKFFTVWGKDIRSFGSNMKMTVNGQESIEYENYQMQDNDKIELRYE